MANITVRDLTDISRSDLFNNPNSFIQDLSDHELNLQGGKRRSVTPVLPPPIVSNWPTPVDSSFDGFSLIVADFYI